MSRPSAVGAADNFRADVDPADVDPAGRNSSDGKPADLIQTDDGSVAHVQAPAVVCSGLVRRFGSVVALDGVNLSVPRGVITAVLGPSGCGKSTLLRVVAGFERPDRGSVAVGGNTVAGVDPSGSRADIAPERRGVGMVPQEQALFPHLNVAANVGYGLARGRKNSQARHARVEAMLELAGLEGLGQRMPFELSGGQQQRVALARALAPSPAVVLLDEPFANLDAALRVSLRAEVRQILLASQTTAVVVTHDQEEALSTADLVAVMRAGRVVQAAPPEDIYRRPADAWVAGFVGDANIVPGELAGMGVVACVLGSLPYRAGALATSGVGRPVAGPTVEVMIRPEQLRLSDPRIDGGVGAPAAVVSHQYFGHDALAQVITIDGTTLVVRVSSGHVPAPGEQVMVACEGEVVCYPAR